MTIFSSLVLAAALQGAALPGPLDAAPPAEVSARLDNAYDALRDAGMSGMVIVTHNGEIIHEATFGSANPETGAAFTRNTRIDMASIAKSFTGMMAARLITDGRLSADDTLGDFFESVPADKARITLHQLLTHSAGFPGAVASDEEQIDATALLERAFAADLLFEPGTRYHYSNTGFTIVAAIIEQVTGQAYEDLLLDSFLLPNGIENTGYTRRYRAEDLPDDLAYTQDGTPLHMSSWGGSQPGWALIGNGGMFTSLAELIAWRNAYNDHALVSPEARTLQQTGYVQEGDGAPSHYGYGVVVEDHPQFGRIYWHNGGSGVFSAHWREYAESGYAVFAASNTARVDADAAMLAATGGIFGVTLQIGSQVSDDDWDMVDFNHNAATRLAGDFLELSRSGTEADRQVFVETRMSQELRSMAPMSGHIGMMDQVGRDVGAMTPTGMVIDAVESVVRVRVESDDGQVMILEFHHESEGDTALMSGLGITD